MPVNARTDVDLIPPWKDQEEAPQYAALREATAGTRRLIHRLLPKVELHTDGLPPDSDEFQHNCLVIARARELAAASLPADLAKAVEHARAMSESAGLFKALAERSVAPVRAFPDTPVRPP
ncbi:DUF6415 family natural product biosynthesis protein [Streptomyces sp. NBC_00838]|uniref:DUF6415 family natural product biosynthesis protein n=1 Tax=Streptomyces sp. NBC_00838 TaxID=2903680 RepID=UPI00386D0653